MKEKRITVQVPLKESDYQRLVSLAAIYSEGNMAAFVRDLIEYGRRDFVYTLENHTSDEVQRQRILEKARRNSKGKI